MNQSSDYESILSQIHQPAFIVQDGLITAINQNAANRFIETNIAADDLISQGKEEYSQLQNGTLYLSINLCGTDYPCVVTCLEDGKLFTVETETVPSELRVLSLAAQQLSFPISELTMLLDQLQDHPKKAQINQNLSRLKRIIRNMADTARYEGTNPNLHYCNATAVLAEILEKSQTLLSQSGIKLTYQLPDQPVYSMINQEMLRRAIYNLLSNAAKFSSNQAVGVKLTRTGSKLYFTVTSQSCSKNTVGNPFNRYLRQPGLEERKYGLGLGMSLIHAAAVVHGGTVLVEQNKKDQFRITVTLSVTKNDDSFVRSPILFPDVYGGNDQALVELSDVLSSELYL